MHYYGHCVRHKAETHRLVVYTQRRIRNQNTRIFASGGWHCRSVLSGWHPDTRLRQGHEGSLGMVGIRGFLVHLAILAAHAGLALVGSNQKHAEHLFERVSGKF